MRIKPKDQVEKCWLQSIAIEELKEVDCQWLDFAISGPNDDGIMLCSFTWKDEEEKLQTKEGKFFIEHANDKFKLCWIYKG